MKNVIASMAILCLFATSCKKETIIVETIVYTDDPPRDMFPANQYAQSYKVYIDNTSIENPETKGWSCFWDQNTGQQRDCSDWYVISAKKFWGFYKGKIYVSASKDWYCIQDRALLQAQTTVRKKDMALGYTCEGCQHPFGNYTWISGIEQ
jgi:hypothetical protein